MAFRSQYNSDMMTSNTQTLRGIGRYAFRKGLMAHQAIAMARAAIGLLTDADRASVMAGWRAERAEAVAA